MKNEKKEKGFKLKNFKIKTYLWSGIVMGILSLAMLISIPSQVRIPGYDSGAPSPRIIPAACLIFMLISSIVLIIQSLVFKKEKVVEFDWHKEGPILILVAGMCLYAALIIWIGFIAASILVFGAVLFYCGERKPLIYIVSFAAAIGIFFLFKYVFYVSLPSLFL